MGAAAAVPDTNQTAVPQPDENTALCCVAVGAIRHKRFVRFTVKARKRFAPMCEQEASRPQEHLGRLAVA